MKIVLLHGSSRKELNSLLYNCLNSSVKTTDQVINLGTLPEDSISLSYLDISLMISILIESKSCDFVVSGCSSGQGLMLACNQLPGLMAGYLPSPEDAYLFGRINNGNVASLPLALGVGWAAEIKFRCIFEALFKEPFGLGYPKNEAKRKSNEANELTTWSNKLKPPLINCLENLPKDRLTKIMNYPRFYEYLTRHANNPLLIQKLDKYRKNSSEVYI